MKVATQPVIRRRITHAEAVQVVRKRWRLTQEEDALILAFCACVGMKMKGGDMDDILLPSNAGDERHEENPKL